MDSDVIKQVAVVKPSKSPSTNTGPTTGSTSNENAQPAGGAKKSRNKGGKFGRPDLITQEQILQDIPNKYYTSWAVKLNDDSGWYKLADSLLLTRKEVKNLQKADNPGKDIFDMIATGLTVGELMQYLMDAGLDDVLQLINQKLVQTVATETEILPQVTNQQSLPRERPPSRREESPQRHYQSDVPNQDNKDTVNSQVDSSEQSHDCIVNNEKGCQTETIKDEDVSTTLIKSVRDPDDAISNSIQQATSSQDNTETILPDEACDMNFEKSADQERAALNRDLDNQINLDSFRNIQCERPERMTPRQLEIQSPEERNGSFSHSEKNIEQEHTEYIVDVTNQPNVDSFRNLHQSSNDETFIKTVDE